MADSWQKALERWRQAGLLDAAVAEDIRAFELQREPPQRLGWPVRIALVFGGIMLGAGVLLLVEAHWETLSPALRLAMVLVMVAAFHAGAGGCAAAFPALAHVLHAVGTASLGAAIFLAGQIFHMQEHWPGAFMLWALGAWLGVGLSRHWAQVGFAAVLTPIGLVGEWSAAAGGAREQVLISSAAVLLLAITYFASPTRDAQDPVRRTLMWIGGLVVIPAAFALALSEPHGSSQLPSALRAVGWSAAVILPLAVAVVLRGREAWRHAVAALWVSAFAAIVDWVGSRTDAGLAVYLWCGLGSIAMIAWGVDESRSERINLGVAGFGLTVFTFYFASAFDHLGRSLSLIGLGLLFLIGGALLEHVRRRLVAKLVGAPG